MRNWFRLTTLIAITLVLFLLLTVYFVNRWDEALRPEVQKLLTKQSEFTYPQSAMPSFYYFLGLVSLQKEGVTTAPPPPARELEEKGEKLWQAGEILPSTLTGASPWLQESPNCNARLCTPEILLKQPELVAELKAHRAAIDSYIHLMEYGEGVDPLRPSLAMPSSPLMILSVDMHAWFLLQMSEWLANGGEARVMDLLAESNRFMHGFYSSGPLLERMIAVQNEAKNVEFVSQVVAQANSGSAARAGSTTQTPGAHKIRVSQEFLDSIVMPEVTQFQYGALDFEVASSYYQLVTHQSLVTLGAKDQFERDVFWALLRPMETINQLYAISAQALSTECPAGVELAQCVPAAVWASFPNPWAYLINPSGRLLVRATASALVNPAQRAGLQRKVDEVQALRAAFTSAESTSARPAYESGRPRGEPLRRPHGLLSKSGL